MSEKVQVLDHGYVQLIEHYGSDERVIEAGRQSVGGEFVSWEPYEGHSKGDFGLLKHFKDKKNTGPFEFAGMVVEVKAPVVVIWQWVRHRTQSYAIMSSRYIPVMEQDYAPSVERCMIDPGKNRQAAGMKGADVLTESATEQWIEQLLELQRHSDQVYLNGLNCGIPKELARLSLTFGRYFVMRCAANLHNWLKFLSLRMDMEAQWEIRQFANEVGKLIEGLFPRTWSLFIGEKNV